MTEIGILWQRLWDTPIPRLAETLDHFALFDSAIALYARRLAEGDAIDRSALKIRPDAQIGALVSELSAKSDLTDEEQEFMDYYSLLDELRTHIEAVARKEFPDDG